MLAQIDEAVKSERLQRLQALLTEQQRAFNAAQIGRTLDILVSGNGRRAGQKHGRSPYLQAVHFNDTTARDGDIVSVRITAASQNSLTGERLALTPEFA
jgi:tRNA-2-methylthio-N6-dimethylallyladenosine synthase